MVDAAVAECPNCGESAPEGATFCEACGQELAAEVVPPCVACGEFEISPEGYCLSCGHRQPRERDHQVLIDGPAVAVSDRGKRHSDNEDAASVASLGGDRPGAVLVVCDGVSSTPGSAEASSRAAQAARDVLVGGLHQEAPRGAGPDGDSSEGADADDPDGHDPDSDGGAWSERVEALLAQAVEAAQAEAAATSESDEHQGVWTDDGPPSSTLVAAVARPIDDRVDLAVAWVGDSRAYWVGTDRAERLTGPDHEIAGSLTRWLGADSAEPVADIALLSVDEPGHLVVCSDGLWRYAAEPDELRAAIDQMVAEGRNGADLALGLADLANGQGGHDNITVALWSNRLDWPGGPAPGETPSEGDR